ncbi:MAG: exodeoxyribonuclease VII large subunit [Phycisphaerales bacterium]
MPFDPTLALGPPRSDAPWSVAELSARVARAITAALPDRVRITGHVSGFRDRTHWYFDLGDAARESVVSCVVFASSRSKAGHKPADGQEIIVTARLDYYAKQGRLTLIVESIEPVGASARELAFRRLVEELRSLGWLDPARKRPMPAFPRQIAVITSRTGAALQDVLDTLRRRAPFVAVAVIDVRVQGDDAPAEIAQALAASGARARTLGIDAILLTRGGGSADDLDAFNQRVVAEAIVACPVPVVAAIGHETDITLAEMVADVRAATPTQAAMRMTPDRAAMLDQLDALGSRMGAAARQHAARARERLTRLARRPVLLDPRTILTARAERMRQFVARLAAATGTAISGTGRNLERLSSRLDGVRPARVLAARAHRLTRAESALAAAMDRRRTAANPRALAERLARALPTALNRRRAHLDALERQLHALGPLAVLERGFSYTRHEDGRLIRSAADVRTGEAIRTQFASGEVRSVVAPDPASIRPPTAAAMPKMTEPPLVESPKPPAEEPSVPRIVPMRKPGQMDLFGRSR